MKWNADRFSSLNCSNLVIKSVITASRNHIIVSTASVFFHSSKCRTFIEDRLHTNDQSSLSGKAISEHKLLCVIGLSLYHSGLLLFTLSVKNIYGYPISTLLCNTFAHVLLLSLLPPIISSNQSSDIVTP